MSQAPGTDPAGPGGGRGEQGGVGQEVTGSGQAQQAALGQGVQHNYFGTRPGGPEAPVSIAPPLGQRDERFPLRGRDFLLNDLAGGAGGPRVHVVHGLAGCGKTRVALEAASMAQQRGAEVWWVSAADEARLIAGMHAVGRRLEVTDGELRHGEAADMVWQRLAQRRLPWLLVIDNADDPALLAGPGGRVSDGTGWLRPLHDPAGLVLVTSRDGRPAVWGPWCVRHPVGALPTGEAVRVLADRAGRFHEALGGDAQAARLADRLGGLPLALRIVGSFLAESAAVPAVFADHDLIRSYHAYLQALDAGGTGAAPGDGGLTAEQVGGLIGRSWELTLDMLEAQRLPEARRLLRLFASLADAPIPHELLLHPGTLAAAAPFSNLTGSRLWQLLQALVGVGLIDMTGAQDATVKFTRLHPLVRDASRPRADTDPAQAREYLGLAAALLRRAAAQTGIPDDPEAWPRWQALAPHAVHVLAALAALPSYPASAGKDAAYAAGMAARYQTSQGLYTTAEELQLAVMTVRMKVLGPDDPETLTARHEIAYSMAARGGHAAAEAEYREVLAAQLRVIGPDHRDTLITRNNIAGQMAAQGNYTAAQAEFSDVLAAKLRVLGPDHSSTLTTRHELAAIMAVQGDHAGAEQELRDILTARLRIQGPDHPYTLATEHEIARMMAAQGDKAGAEAAYRKVLATKLRVLGPNHPDTLTTRQEIARMMAEQGQHAGAEAEYRDVLAARIAVLGPGHPDTLITRHNIAAEMSAQFDTAGALAEFLDVLAAKRKLLGDTHPSTMVTAEWVKFLEEEEE
jgi:RecA/RadA recombinase